MNKFNPPHSTDAANQACLVFDSMKNEPDLCKRISCFIYAHKLSETDLEDNKLKKEKKKLYFLLYFTSFTLKWDSVTPCRVSSDN